MPATALDSAVFRDIFSTEAMRRVFSDENRVQCYLDIEAALARVQARLGIIPARRPRRSAATATPTNSTCALLKTQTERIGYPVLPVVQQLVGLCQRRSRRMVPLGRDDAGHHRHRDGAADSRRARCWSRPTSRRSRIRSPASRGATATRRWRGAATCSRPCRSPSATRRRCCSPASSAIARGCRAAAARAGRRVRRRRRQSLLARHATGSRCRRR